MVKNSILLIFFQCLLSNFAFSQISSKFQGRVIDGNGSPITDLPIDVDNGANPTLSNETTGRFLFEFPNVKPGERFSLQIDVSNWEFISPKSGKCTTTSTINTEVEDIILKKKASKKQVKQTIERSKKLIDDRKSDLSHSVTFSLLNEFSKIDSIIKYTSSISNAQMDSISQGIEQKLNEIKNLLHDPTFGLTSSEIYQRGRRFLIAGDYDQAKVWFLESAELANTSAQHNLGLLLLQDSRIPLDCKKGMKWLELSALNGNANAMNSLASELHKGNSCTGRNTTSAFEWMKKSVDSGNTNAVCNLAQLYREGEGTKKDKQLAVELLAPLADIGNCCAMRELAITYLEGWNIGKRDEAKILLEKCIKECNNDPEAQKVLCKYFSNYKRNHKSDCN